MAALSEGGIECIISAQLESVFVVARVVMASAPRSGAIASESVMIKSSNVRNRVFTVIRLVLLCMTRQALTDNSFRPE